MIIILILMFSYKLTRIQLQKDELALIPVLDDI